MYNERTGMYFQEQLVHWGPRILIAILILLVTWVVARLVRSAIRRAAERVPALKRQSAARPNETVGHQLGTVASLIVWLVGILAALQFLGLGQILQPVSALTNNIFEFLPRLIGAGLIFFIGLIIARIVRELVETVVGAANFEGIAGRLRTSGAPDDRASAARTETAAASSKAGIARAAGIVVFALIIIPVAIAALQVLGIEAISGPAINMLNQILAAIPRILSAALWLGIAFLAARLLKSIIEAVLPPAGFDRAVHSVGIVPASTSPSRVVANVVFVVVMLGAGIEAARQLGGETIAQFLAEITALGARVLFGTLIILAGIFLARMVAGLVGSTGDGGFTQTLVRAGIIALAVAIGLRFMGLANEIVILAFGLILGSAALAAGLAFGLGGRRPAERLLDSYVDESSPSKPASSRARTPKNSKE